MFCTQVKMMFMVLDSKFISTSKKLKNMPYHGGNGTYDVCKANALRTELRGQVGLSTM